MYLEHIFWLNQKTDPHSEWYLANPRYPNHRTIFQPGVSPERFMTIYQDYLSNIRHYT